MRILRHDFSCSKQVEDDLEKLIEIKHRWVKGCFLGIWLYSCPNSNINANFKISLIYSVHFILKIIF